MICSSCGNDNPRTYLECMTCGQPLSSIRCTCGFPNYLLDSFCGSCGEALVKTSFLSRIQSFESNSNPVPNFSQQELMRIIELQQMQDHAEHSGSNISQGDIDKLFE